MKMSIKIAILFAAVMQFMAPTALTVFAQPSNLTIGKERGHARLFVEPVFIGRGFALQRDQYHFLDINAIKMSPVSPNFIHSLFLRTRAWTRW